jgi:dihydrofolate reductase
MLPTNQKLIAIAAMASNRVIGRDGKLPWHLPEDLKFFKATTLGHPVLMGRKTFESIVARLGKPLPGRVNIVLSKTMSEREGVHVIRDVADLRATLTGLHPSSSVFLIGGAQLYESLLPQCDELLLTFVEQPHEGDAFFPRFEDAFDLKEVLGRGEGFEFRRYVRRPG